MSRRIVDSRRTGWSVLASICLSLIVSSQANAQGDAAAPLARYVPADGLTLLIEHNGLDARPDAWKGTAAYKMLNETSLGVMFEDIATQLADRALQGARGVPATGKDVVALLKHLAQKGFVVAFCGSFNPPQPRAAVVVIRGGARSEVFRRLIAKIPPLNEPVAKQVDAPGGRKVWVAAESPIRWWYEKDDAVFSFAPPGAPDPVVNTLEGKTASALTHPTRIALAKAEDGQVSVGLLFVDLSTLPPPSPQAVQLGLDGIKRVEARWAIQGKGLLTTIGIQAPRPRRGLLALFDQPAIGAGTKFVPPSGVTGYTLLSLDPIKFGDALLALVKQSDPQASASLAQFAQRFRARTGLSLRDDLLGKLGPRMALFMPPGAGGSLMGMWFHPPDFGLVAEVKDARGFVESLDRLMQVANRELRAAGAMVPPQPGRPSRPGTEFAEFRRLKAPERGYVLSVPPSALPTPAAFRPTVAIDLERGLVALAASPATARLALSSLVLKGPGATEGRDAVLVSQSDPSGMLPELLTNLPSIVQFIGLAVSQSGGPAQSSRPFRLQIDPDTIPDAGALRAYLFPSRSTLAVDDRSIRLSTYEAFPLPAPQLDIGTEAPVLIALLLPAVQAAREAARRSQCVNNLKQIGLAMHNYVSTNGKLPASAIVDKQGKPLLSWRVAILPYIEYGTLYNKFKLDEPWDSPHNRELIKYMPNTYSCPSRTDVPGSGTTTYRAFSGRGAILDPTRPTAFAEVTDGLSTTLLVVESSDAVTWTKPDDLPFDIERAQPQGLLGAGSKHSGGFNVLMGDGSVRFIKMTISPMIFRALITKAGGEIIGADGF
jgi:prepilin-type processing-associated H-X9-DG protein